MNRFFLTARPALQVVSWRFSSIFILEDVDPHLIPVIGRNRDLGQSPGCNEGHHLWGGRPLLLLVAQSPQMIPRFWILFSGDHPSPSCSCYLMQSLVIIQVLVWLTSPPCHHPLHQRQLLHPCSHCSKKNVATKNTMTYLLSCKVSDAFLASSVDHNTTCFYVKVNCRCIISSIKLSAHYIQDFFSVRDDSTKRWFNKFNVPCTDRRIYDFCMV